jgi:hypothetical protein
VYGSGVPTGMSGYSSTVAQNLRDVLGGNPQLHSGDEILGAEIDLNLPQQLLNRRQVHETASGRSQGMRQRQDRSVVR